MVTHQLGDHIPSCLIWAFEKKTEKLTLQSKLSDQLSLNFRLSIEKTKTSKLLIVVC